ncbi:coiled-coil domain-containing protein 9 isoform X3 [Gopherus evgoodei]|uniref:coiled-coil domain-containing protein 9 isoform X3 n=1 Tax=Gopherus evgoodei TaxID=1825980 RepID=UPI0011D00E35|nr:coiled-coil domain-containing protein 9 isoform X3 [Gopherus evgoodei]
MERGPGPPALTLIGGVAQTRGSRGAHRQTGCRGPFKAPPHKQGSGCGAQPRGAVGGARQGEQRGQQSRPARPAPEMSATLDLKSKEEKDAELDKRIEALRKKNQALIKRYQEIEEDRKKAEQEGIAVTGSRRPRHSEGEPERKRVDKDVSITVQVSLSPGEKRVVSGRKSPGAPKAGRGPPPRGAGRVGPYPSSRSPRTDQPDLLAWEGAGGGRGDGPSPGGRGRRPRGRGGAGTVTGSGDGGPDRKSKEWEERRRQNIEKMNEEMEKIAEYERNQRDGLQEKNPVRNFLDDPRRSGSFQEADRKEGSRRHVRNWGGPDFDKVKTGMEQEKEWHALGRRPGPKSGGPLDMTLSMTGRERAEYVRWKKEREQIDQERLARHRKPTGQWCREWDAEKTDTMFKEGCGTVPGPDPGARRDENKHPPRPPTFGEFLSEHRAERRRKGRGRPVTAKPYSMHDNRWEEKDEGLVAEEPDPHHEEPQAEGLATQLPPEPRQPPDEDEDQWEDVEEEEEEEDEGHLSSSGEEEEEAEPLVESPKAPRALKVGRGPAPKLDMPPPGAHGGQGKTLSPFSPTEGYQPVSDWGEEMELNSPRGSVGDSPCQAQRAGPPGETAAAEPGRRGTAEATRQEEPVGGSMALAAPGGTERTEELGVPATQGATETSSQLEAKPAPGVVQITDVEQDKGEP